MAALLTARSLAIAEVAHAHWLARLGKVRGLDDCSAVAAAQQEAGLPVDGILAPPTRAALRGERFVWPTAGSLLCGGKLCPLPAGLRAVVPEGPLALSLAGTTCFRPRTAAEKAALDLVVLHWDECDSSLHCYHTLLWRQLSAHLLLDADGVIFQTLDLRESCAFHARTHNPRSVGIEINNALYFAGGEGRPLLCEPRAHTTERWHVAGFTPAQHDALARLVPWLCQELGIPAALPYGPAGTVADSLIAANFQGICGHFHLQKDKVDPGFSLWPTLEKKVQGLSVG